MTVSWQNPETGQDILRSLASVPDKEVSVSFACRSRDGTVPCWIPVEGVTDKQLEATTLAVENGYYEQPREADLTDIAATIGITPSAVSQRLNAVERKLMIALATACE